MPVRQTLARKGNYCSWVYVELRPHPHGIHTVILRPHAWELLLGAWVDLPLHSSWPNDDEEMIGATPSPSPYISSDNPTPGYWLSACTISMPHTAKAACQARRSPIPRSSVIVRVFFSTLHPFRRAPLSSENFAIEVENRPVESLGQPQHRSQSRLRGERVRRKGKTKGSRALDAKRGAALERSDPRQYFIGFLQPSAYAGGTTLGTTPSIC